MILTERATRTREAASRRIAKMSSEKNAVKKVIGGSTTSISNNKLLIDFFFRHSVETRAHSVSMKRAIQ